MERKYRQKGYMDAYQQEKREKKPAAPKPAKPAGPRWQQPERPKTPQMPGTQVVVRCGGCGTVLPVGLESFEQCPKCGFELHSCKQCAHFDPGSRFECARPIPERIAGKDARNDCAYFELRTRVEREASAGSKRPQDARRAFENLFKK